MILFEGANPRWESDHIIYTKSNLDLLPDIKDKGTQASDKEPNEGLQDEATTTPDSGGGGKAGQAVAIFKQHGSRGTSAAYTFDGWYKISRIQFLAPESDELVRMLEQKWTKVKGGKTIQEARSSAGFKRSLSLRWAVVQFEKDDLAASERGVPAIERKAEPPRKSVNEMLAELRVRDVTNQAAAKETARSKAE